MKKLLCVIILALLPALTFASGPISGGGGTSYTGVTSDGNNGLNMSGLTIAPVYSGNSLIPAIDVSCTGWTLGSGWACGGDGTIVKNADGTGTATYTYVPTPSYLYEVSFTLGSLTGGNINAYFTSSSGDGQTPWISAVGAYKTYWRASKATANTYTLTINPSATGTRVILSAVTIKYVINANTLSGLTTVNGPLILHDLAGGGAANGLIPYKGIVFDSGNTGDSAAVQGIWSNGTDLHIGDSTESTSTLYLHGQAVYIRSNSHSVYLYYDQFTGSAGDIDLFRFRHLIFAGAAIPTVGTGASDCGTSPTVDSNATDSAGKVTVGSSTNGGVCTITFNAPSKWLNAPVCMAQNDTTAALVRTTARSTTIFKLTGIFLAGDVLSWICVGN